MAITTNVSYGDPNFTPSYSGTMTNPNNAAAYGSNIPAVTPASTAAANQTQAIQLGQQQYAQLPGYSSSLGNVGSNIQAETAGQLPQDVINQITQQAAERGIATGSPGSPNSNASYLQALGLNSLQLTNTGEQNLNSATAALPGLNSSQIAADQVSPNLAYTAAYQNAVNAAAPNPSAAAAANAGGFSAGLGLGGSGMPTATTIPSYTAPAAATGTTAPWNTTQTSASPIGASTTDLYSQLYQPTTTSTGDTTQPSYAGAGTTAYGEPTTGDFWSQTGLDDDYASVED